MWYFFLALLRYSSASAVPRLTAFGNSSITSAASKIPWGPSYQNFIPLPSDQAGDCDIFGPLCQTGTAIIDLDQDGTTTTTAVPCSSYLVAQSKWVSLRMQSADTEQASVWATSFGRSPECTTFAKAAFPDEMFPASPPPPLSGCPNNASGLLKPFNDYLPWGIQQTGSNGNYDCCGQCKLCVPSVRVIYFPDLNAPTCDNQHSKNNTITPTVKSITEAPNQTLPVTAVFSDYTFTSPSIYLQVIGIASVIDECGELGPQYTSAIVALPSGALSSYSWSTPVGGTVYIDPYSFTADFTKEVKVSDLQCPTWGLASTSTNTLVYGMAGGYSVGPPFNPAIQPPPQLTEIDPQWQACPVWFQQSGTLASWAIPDPPYALTPLGQMDTVTWPTMTSSSGPPRQTNPTPAQAISSVPSPTSSLTLSTDPYPSALVIKSSSLGNFEATSTRLIKASSLLVSAQVTTSSVPSQAALNDPFLSNNLPASNNPPVSNDPPSANNPTQATESGPGIGGIIWSAFGGTPIQASTTLLDPNTASPGSADPKIGEIVYSISQGPLVTWTVALPAQPSSNPSNAPISNNPSGPLAKTASQTSLDRLPTAVVVEGQTIEAGGPAVWMSGGVPISLETNGVLVAGTNTINIDSPSTATATAAAAGGAAAIFTVGGTAYTYTEVGVGSDSSVEVVIDQQTLIPGGKITISGGDVLSLAPSNTAIVIFGTEGSRSTEALPSGGGYVASATGAQIGSGSSFGNSTVTATGSAETTYDVTFSSRATTMNQRGIALWGWSCSWLLIAVVSSAAVL